MAISGPTRRVVRILWLAPLDIVGQHGEYRCEVALSERSVEVAGCISRCHWIPSFRRGRPHAWSAGHPLMMILCPRVARFGGPADYARGSHQAGMTARGGRGAPRRNPATAGEHPHRARTPLRRIPRRVDRKDDRGGVRGEVADMPGSVDRRRVPCRCCSLTRADTYPARRHRGSRTPSLQASRRSHSPTGSRRR